MEREERYVVIKLSDIEEGLKLGHLSPSNITTLQHIVSKVWHSRVLQGKEDLKTVVVESDWPEYETVWDMIERRVEFESTEDAEYNRGWDEAIMHIGSGEKPYCIKGISPYCQGWNTYMYSLMQGK